ncbi:MAG: hypothetical protein AB7U81_15615 [Thiohalomonadaceae bacterium]
MDQNVTYTKHMTADLASAIVQVIRENIPGQNGSVRINAYNKWESLPAEVHDIEMHRRNDIPVHNITAPDATFVPDLAKEDIQRAVSAKEPKLSAYREKADQVWLVVTIDSGSMATWYSDKDPGVYSGYSSEFDRVFVLWVVSGSVRELELARGAQS